MHACMSCEQRKRTESKRKANELLASETVTAQEWQALLDADGTLDASPMGERVYERERVLDTAECVKAVTRHAAAALQSCGIKCLDLQGNKRVATLPARELCSIESLVSVQCGGCITTIPASVAERGGEEAMAALHESLYSSHMSQFATDVAGPMELEDHAAALDVLHVIRARHVTRERHVLIIRRASRQPSTSRHPSTSRARNP